MKGGQVVALVFSELIFLGVEVVNVLCKELGFGIDSNSLFEDFHGVFFLELLFFLLFFNFFYFLEFNFFLFVIKPLLSFKQADFGVGGDLFNA